MAENVGFCTCWSHDEFGPYYSVRIQPVETVRIWKCRNCQTGVYFARHGTVETVRKGGNCQTRERCTQVQKRNKYLRCEPASFTSKTVNWTNFTGKETVNGKKR